MSFLDIFEETFSTYKRTVPKEKDVSRIKMWLGHDVTNSVSIKVGGIIENIFKKALGDAWCMDLLDATKKRGRYFIKGHEIDLCACIGNTLIVREMKTNLNLDSGKKRDMNIREKSIVDALKDLGLGDVDANGLFNPFFMGYSKPDSSFGTVYGLTWFINTFKDYSDLDDLNCEDFIQYGRSDELFNMLELWRYPKMEMQYYDYPTCLYK